LEETVIVLASATSLAILALLGFRMRIAAPKVSRWMRSLRNADKPDSPIATHGEVEILFDSHTLVVISHSGSSKPRRSLDWKSVQEVTAFKVDRWGTDQVTLSFQSTNGLEIIVHEEMKGWSELCQALPDRLPGAPRHEDWFMPITTPAFAPNPVCLFRRRTRPPQ